MIVIYIFLGVYAFQLLIVGVMFYSEDYEKKDNMVRDMIPYYWFVYSCEWIYNRTIDLWNELK